jgi:tRNA(Arg) A34 adenosine deaminase TadA
MRKRTNRFKIVAFILDAKGRILTEGWNSYTKTHPIQRNAALVHKDIFKHFLHAEIHALSRLGKRLGKQDSIVVFRMGADKRLLPAEPCKICSSVIEQYGIERVIHS